jgi:hypothetical protein
MALFRCQANLWELLLLRSYSNENENHRTVLQKSRRIALSFAEARLGCPIGLGRGQAGDAEPREPQGDRRMDRREDGAKRVLEGEEMRLGED